jgi:uncharacterized protein
MNKPYRRFERAGQAMSDPYVLDCHHHYGTLVMSTDNRTASLEAAQRDPAEHATRVGRLRAAEIDAAIVMPINRYIRPEGVKDTQRVNDDVASYRDADPVNFPLAVGISEPLHVDAALDEIARIDESLGMIGVSYHTRWQGVATDDPLVLRGLAEVRNRRMLAFVHAWHESMMEAPFMIAHLAETLPDLPIIVTDALSSNVQTQQLMRDARQFPNLHFDTSCSWNIRVIERWVDTLGPDQLVFGTDTYSAHMVTNCYPRLIREVVSEDDAERILHGNLERLIAWTGRPYSRPTKG